MAASYEDCARINRISQETGIPCFVAYYRRYLPYFQKVRQMVEDGEIGNVINIQIRFAQPPRDLDYNSTNLPWRVQPDIAGGGYFYDLAPHQLDLLQDMFGCILEAQGYKSNRGGLYPAEDTISACFKFDSGLPGSGSWCFVAHESAKEDRIEIIGDKGMICFSVFTYDPIALHTERGREEFLPENPPHVQLPLIKAVVEHLQGKAVCTCDGISATPTNWVMDRGLYPAEDTISACFKFDSGLPGSGSWCFVAHESAKEDRIEIIGDKGMICFSVFTYDPIALHTERGREEFLPENPPHVQLPLIKAVVEHLQGKAVCTCDGISATPTNWVMDRILNKL